MEREGLLVTRWLNLTESSTYQPWKSIMVSHIAVDQFNSHADLEDSCWLMSPNCVVDQLLYGIPS